MKDPNVDPKHNHQLKWKLYTQRKPINSKEKHKDTRSLRILFFLPPSESAILCPWLRVKYEMLPSWVSNQTIASCITYMAGVICAWPSMNNSGYSFTACWKIGTALFPNFLLSCANIFVLSSNILLQSESRPSHSRKHFTNHLSWVSSLLELLLVLPGVASRSGFGVPICIWSVGFAGDVLASFPVAAGGVEQVSFSVAAGRIVLASCSVDTGEIVRPSPSVGTGGSVPAYFSVGVLVPSSHPSSASSIKSPPTLLLFFFFSFALICGVGGESILLLSGDGGGTDISWSAGGANGEIV